MTRVLGVIATVWCMTAVMASPATAQNVYGEPAVVVADGPVYLLPDAARTPLRTLAAGTPLMLLAQKGDWFQVTFEDAQLGRRTGWMEARFVRMRPADTPPSAAPAAGQPAPPNPVSQKTAAPPPRPSTAIGVRVFGGGAVTRMSASDSFEAVTGSDVVWSYGGGVQVTNLWRGLFIEAAIERSTVDGERVFAFADEVFPLGIPLKVTMMPIDTVLGWRVGHDRLTSYVGGGLTIFRYEETSDFADPDENVDKQYLGFVVMGGVEVSVTRWLHVRADLRYRQVNDALGIGGVSEHFDEDRLGGFGAGLHLVVGR